MKILTAISTAVTNQYQLIDSGNGYKLERFGNNIIARPDTNCVWNKTDAKRIGKGCNVKSNGIQRPYSGSTHLFQLTSLRNLRATSKSPGPSATINLKTRPAFVKIKLKCSYVQRYQKT